VTGRPEPVVTPERPFSALLNDLLRDSEQLPTIGPVQPTPEHLRRLERKQIVVERVDADGRVHPEVLKGDTREGWVVRDYVDRVLGR
jgi:hypothetical protein